jgi:O-antigen ligase
MAQMSFGQPFVDGLLYIRHSFNYFLFFPFFILLSTEGRMRFFLKITVIFVALLGIVALLQKADPSLPIFNYLGGGEGKYTDPLRMRFGDYRLIFPHVEFALLIFFMVLSELVNRNKVKWVLPKAAFLFLIAFVLVATGTRSHLIAVFIVSGIAFIAGPKRWLKISGVVFCALCLLLQIFSFAVSQQGFSFFTENKVAKTFESSLDTSDGSIKDRLAQCKMYWRNFLKSPIAGVGTLRYSSHPELNYRQYGFYNNNDIGYLKILAEYGLIGFLWVGWFFFYMAKGCWNIIKSAPADEKDVYCDVIAKGILSYILYVAISMITLPHLIEGNRIIPIVLAMVFLETARRIRSKEIGLKSRS